jgi:hypothetical protein
MLQYGQLHASNLTLTFVFQFLEGCIERTPDIYLSELQQALNEACGINISEVTIALHHRGFSRKKVRFMLRQKASILLTDWLSRRAGLP